MLLDDDDDDDDDMLYIDVRSKADSYASLDYRMTPNK